MPSLSQCKVRWSQQDPKLVKAARSHWQMPSLSQCKDKHQACVNGMADRSQKVMTPVHCSIQIGTPIVNGWHYGKCQYPVIQYSLHYYHYWTSKVYNKYWYRGNSTVTACLYTTILNSIATVSPSEPHTMVLAGGISVMYVSIMHTSLHCCNGRCKLLLLCVCGLPCSAGTQKVLGSIPAIGTFGLGRGRFSLGWFHRIWSRIEELMEKIPRATLQLYPIIQDFFGHSSAVKLIMLHTIFKSLTIKYKWTYSICS